MACQETVYQWTDEVHSRLPQLSRPQATVLALWSLGMVLARSGALPAVTLLLAVWQGRQEDAVRQQLREFCYAARDKRGAQRRELAVAPCCVPLLRWAIAGYPGTQLALALDATTLGQRFVVLAVSVVYRGCAIPVAWTILPAGDKHAWRREWLRMLRWLRPASPVGWTVIVLADRGLDARWLFRRIVRLGWHPFRPAGRARFVPLAGFARAPGRRWAGRGAAFVTAACRLRCTLLARWEDGYQEPWLILTDLPPEAADAGWYGVRAWIEQGFKVTKRAGWHWQRTRMTDPERASRLWLAVAVATRWLLRVGGAAEDTIPESTLLPVATLPTARRRRATRLRLVSLFRRGWTVLVVALLNHAPLPLGTFRPDPWPAVPARPGRPGRDVAEVPDAA